MIFDGESDRITLNFNEIWITIIFWLDPVEAIDSFTDIQNEGRWGHYDNDMNLTIALNWELTVPNNPYSGIRIRCEADFENTVESQELVSLFRIMERRVLHHMSESIRELELSSCDVYYYPILFLGESDIKLFQEDQHILDDEHPFHSQFLTEIIEPPSHIYGNWLLIRNDLPWDEPPSLRDYFKNKIFGSFWYRFSLIFIGTGKTIQLTSNPLVEQRTTNMLGAFESPFSSGVNEEGHTKDNYQERTICGQEFRRALMPVKEIQREILLYWVTTGHIEKLKAKSDFTFESELYLFTSLTLIGITLTWASLINNFSNQVKIGLLILSISSLFSFIWLNIYELVWWSRPRRMGFRILIYTSILVGLLLIFINVPIPSGIKMLLTDF